MTAPCKGCPRRELGCHDRCEKYQAFRKWRLEVVKRMKDDHDVSHCEFERYKTKYRRST